MSGYSRVGGKSPVRIEINQKDLDMLNYNLDKFAFRVGSKQAEKRVDEVLKYAVQPWQTVFNSGLMYKFLNKKTGSLQKPMGNRKIKSTRRKQYGRKVLPISNSKSKKQGGWKAHFFSRPAKHIDRGKRVNFKQIYASKSKQVIARANQGLSDLIQNIANRSFK